MTTPKSIIKHQLPNYQDIPDISLYMDQLIEYLDRNLSSLKRNDKTPVFTSTMVNNYVKSDVIVAPTKKKYAKETISELHIVYYLKQILSIQDTKRILDLLLLTDDFETVYTCFTDEIKSVYHTLEQELSQTEDKKKLLTKMAAEASVRKQIVESLLDELSSEENNGTDIPPK